MSYQRRDLPTPPSDGVCPPGMTPQQPPRMPRPAWNVGHLVVCPSNNWQWVGMISGVSKPVSALSVTDAQREVLESLARSQSGAHREVVRAKALLMAADGASNAT